MGHGGRYRFFGLQLIIFNVNLGDIDFLDIYFCFGYLNSNRPEPERLSNTIRFGYFYLNILKSIRNIPKMFETQEKENKNIC